MLEPYMFPRAQQLQAAEEGGDRTPPAKDKLLEAPAPGRSTLHTWPSRRRGAGADSEAAAGISSAWAHGLAQRGAPAWSRSAELFPVLESGPERICFGSGGSL
jgi:hypothetical protein